MKSYLYRILLNKLYKTKQYLFNLNDKFPLIGSPLVYGYFFLYIFRWKLETKILKIRTHSKYGKLDFNKICWVNPHKIQYCISDHIYNKWNMNARILNGDWDLSKKRFEDIGMVNAIEQRFKDGKKWEEMKIYHEVLDTFSRGITWGYINKDGWDKHLREIDSLYYQIKKNGYKSKKELYYNRNFHNLIENLRDKKKILDDITLAIGRDGQFLFVNGRHRLKIAKLLNIHKVPCVIVLRHRKWMEFRKKLIDFTKKCKGGKLNYQIKHPDLQDISFKHGNLSFKLIKENLSSSSGILLDIGTNLGYFCQKFEDEGFNCNKIEQNKLRLYFLKKIKKGYNNKFLIIPTSIFEYIKDKELVFDVVLALNFFQYSSERKEDFLTLIELLKGLKIKELFLGVPNSKNFSYRRYNKNNHLNQCLDLIVKNSSFNKVQFIGQIEDNRQLYKFT